MNDKTPNANIAMIAFVLMLIGLGCGSLNRPEATGDQTAAPENRPAQTQTASDEIGGDYTVYGSNPNGTSYTGNLTVTNRGEVYQFTWASGGREYDGVGVRADRTVAVAFTEGADGQGCGVVLYKIAADGSLDGKAGYWGVNESEIEKAVRTSGTDLAGVYDVSGTDSSGKEYKGTLAVNKRGAGYNFQWDVGGGLNGFGIRTGDMAAVGFGGSKCGFVSYDIKPDGSLEGKWGGQGSTVVGTETARKR